MGHTLYPTALYYTLRYTSSPSKEEVPPPGNDLRGPPWYKGRVFSGKSAIVALGPILEETDE